MSKKKTQYVIGFPLQIILVIGKLLELPYLTEASWWLIFLPTLIPLGFVAIALLFIGVYVLLALLLERWSNGS